MASAAPARVDRKLQLKEVLDWLVADGLVDGDTAAKMLHDGRFAKGTARHPLIVVGETRIRSRVPPGNFLTPDALTEWLAARLKIPFYRIDPLKIDLKSVTQVMSS